MNFTAFMDRLKLEQTYPAPHFQVYEKDEYTDEPFVRITFGWNLSNEEYALESISHLTKGALGVSTGADDALEVITSAFIPSQVAKVKIEVPNGADVKEMDLLNSATLVNSLGPQIKELINVIDSGRLKEYLNPEAANQAYTILIILDIYCPGEEHVSDFFNSDSECFKVASNMFTSKCGVVVAFDDSGVGESRPLRVLTKEELDKARL